MECKKSNASISMLVGPYLDFLAVVIQLEQVMCQGERTSTKIKFICTHSSADRKAVSTSFYHA